MIDTLIEYSACEKAIIAHHEECPYIPRGQLCFEQAEFYNAYARLKKMGALICWKQGKVTLCCLGQVDINPFVNGARLPFRYTVQWVADESNEQGNRKQLVTRCAWFLAYYDSMKREVERYKAFQYAQKNFSKDEYVKKARASVTYAVKKGYIVVQDGLVKLGGNHG